VPWRYADNLLVLDNKVEAATGTAIRACGWYVLHIQSLPLTIGKSEVRTLRLVIFFMIVD